MTISNGCICCSLRKDIVSALSELKRRSAAAGHPYDNIILETTGLADPAPVAFTFFANPWVKRHFQLDSIVYAPCPAQEHPARLCTALSATAVHQHRLWIQPVKVGARGALVAHVHNH